MANFSTKIEHEMYSASGQDDLKNCRLLRLLHSYHDTLILNYNYYLSWLAMNLKMGFDWSLRRLTLKAKRAGVAVDFKSVIHATRSLNVCHRNLDSFGFFFETNAVSMVSVNLEGLVSGMLSMSD
jgi:hypothetical protein